MLSPRILAVAAVLATVAAVPTTDRPIPKPVTTITDVDVDDTPWFSFPLFGNLFAPLWRLFPSFADIGPRIIADDKKFQVIVNVKDYKKEDLKVKIKKDLIFIQGTHEAKQDDRDIYASQFFHTYSLPANSSASDVTAELSSDGFLVLNAPIDGPVDRAKDQEVDREVPIVETNTPFQKEESTPTTVASVTTEDDRKEPTTTPADITDVTDQDKKVNDNEIPL